MLKTPKLQLNKPEGTDVVNIADLNANMDKLDTEVTKLATPSADGRMSKDDKAKLNALPSGAHITQLSNSLTTHFSDYAIDAHNATNISVADVNNRFTGTNVETVLDELFQFANNGKTDIASVIGSPATSGDTFAQLKTHIQNSKNDLAINLSAKGQASVGTEPLAFLVDKVALVNTGKKFASATGVPITSSASYPDTLIINGLDMTVEGVMFLAATTGYPIGVWYPSLSIPGRFSYDRYEGTINVTQSGDTITIKSSNRMAISSAVTFSVIVLGS